MEKAVILVVEDEPLVGLELRESLLALGYQVPEVVNCGDQVMEEVLRHKPDLILMDIRLKGFTDGIEVVGRIKSISQAAIIYMSAFSTPEMLDRAIKTEPIAYLLKPVDPKQLQIHIELALSKLMPSQAQDNQANLGSTIINALYSAAILLDADQIIRAVNPAARQILNEEPGHPLTGTYFQEHLLDDSWKREALRTFFRLPWVGHDGAVLNLHVRKELLPQDQHTRPGTLLLLEDIDPRERKLMEHIGSDINNELMSLLPQNTTFFPHFSIDGVVLPSESGSGDIYDVFDIDEDRAVFYLLDVMGHGTMSAMLACMLHEVIRSNCEQELKQSVEQSRDFSPATILEKLNKKYQRRESNTRYFSIVLGVIDRRDGSYQIVHAGHPSAVLLGLKGASQVKIGNSPAIGVFEQAIYQAAAGALVPGERLMLFSDGFLTRINREENGNLSNALDMCGSIGLKFLGNPIQDTLEALIEKRRQPTDAAGEDASALIVEFHQSSK